MGVSGIQTKSPGIIFYELPNLSLYRRKQIYKLKYLFLTSNLEIIWDIWFVFVVESVENNILFTLDLRMDKRYPHKNVAISQIKIILDSIWTSNVFRYWWHFNVSKNRDFCSTLSLGKRRINSVGHQLQMNQHCIDTAYNFYKLAVNKHLTRGRRTNHVVAACLYLVCRTEKTPRIQNEFKEILLYNSVLSLSFESPLALFSTPIPTYYFLANSIIMQTAISHIK